MFLRASVMKTKSSTPVASESLKMFLHSVLWHSRVSAIEDLPTWDRFGSCSDASGYT